MIICDIKIDFNICEPHYVNVFFLWNSSIVQMLVFFTFDIFLTTWHLLTFLSLAYVVWGKVIISHLSVCLHRGSSWGYLSQLGGYLPWPGMYLHWWFQKIFLFGRVWWSWKNFLGGCFGPIKCQNISSCQKDVKLSKRCQMSKSQIHGLWRRFTKKLIHIMRLTHIDINFDIKYEGHQNCWKTLSMHILRVFGHHHMWRQNLHQYVWTSLCQFIFFVWTSSIVHVFDFLTFNIFLTTWHLFNIFLITSHIFNFLTHG